MSARSEAYAKQLEQVTQDVIALVEKCPDAKWTTPTKPESWPVCTAAHHIAIGYGPITQFVQAAANNQALPPFTPEMLHAGNAQHAQEFANVSKAATLTELRAGVAGAAAALRSLTDAQLDRTGTLFGNTMTAGQIVERILINHVVEHTASIKDVID